MKTSPSVPAGTVPARTSAEIAAALQWAAQAYADTEAAKHVGVLAAELRRRQADDIVASMGGRALPLKAPALALDELVRFACGARHSSSGLVLRNILASFCTSPGPIDFRPVNFLDDRHCANLLSVLDGLLVGTRGRIYDQTIKEAFIRHGGEDWLYAVSA
jgi:hypothetical protein